MKDLNEMFEQSKNSIEQSSISNPSTIYNRVLASEESKKVLKKINIFKYSTISLASFLIVFIVLGLAGVFTKVETKFVEKEVVKYINGPSNIEHNTSSTNDNTTYTFTNKDELLKVINSNSASSYILNIDANDSTSIIAPSETFPQDEKSSADSLDDVGLEYSTNVLVEGIDEADIIKVYKNYVAYVPYNKKKLIIFKETNNKLEIYKTYNYESVVAKEEDNNEFDVFSQLVKQPKELYFTDKYLIARVTSLQYCEVEYTNQNNKIQKRSYLESEGTEFIIYDLDNFEQVYSVFIDGTLLASRLKNNELIIVNSSTNNMLASNPLPVLYLNDALHYSSLSAIYFCPTIYDKVNHYIDILKISLDDEITMQEAHILSSNVSKVFVSENYIYLLSNVLYKETLNNDVYTRNDTKVCVISYNEDINVDSNFSFKGVIHDDFSFNEYNNIVRVVVKVTETSYKQFKRFTFDRKTTFTNSLYIVEKDNNTNTWKEISSITDGIGYPGEDIKSVRFDKDICTIVTFKQTDPLYYVDLSNPSKPIISSELKVNGFSEYQHVYKDNYIIGIGYEADEFGVTKGFKVSLFDISDKSKLRQLCNSIVFSYSDNYSTLSALSDYKRFFFDLERDLFGFAICKNEKYRENNKTYYSKSCSFIVFKIDINNDNPLSIVLDEKINFEGSLSSNASSARMIFINDNYYYFSNDLLYAYSYDGNKFIKEYEISY